MIYKVVISDRDFNVIEEVQNKIENPQWGYGRLGGCESFSFDVPIRYAEDASFGGNYNIKIYRRNPSTNSFDLWYQGRIENKRYNVKGKRETINISGNGYQSELKGIYVDSDYSSMEVSAIVKDILDNYIIPNTNITYDAGDIESTGYTPDSLEFNTDALSCFETLAKIVGTREWGVDRNRKFFFKARSETVTRTYAMPGKVLSYDEDMSFDIVNRVIVIGGDVSGTPFTRVVDDAQSQLKWNRRDKVIQNSSIVTNDVADQFASAVFAEFSAATFRARAEILDEALLENTTPIGLVQIIPSLATYGTKRFGQGLYSAPIQLQVNKVTYKVDKNRNLVMSIDLGEKRPSISEAIGQLENKINNINAKGV